MLTFFPPGAGILERVYGRFPGHSVSQSCRLSGDYKEHVYTPVSFEKKKTVDKGTAIAQLV
jgi:hypothetical protein